MQTILFHSTIFGPIHSRRLGTSLGVNLSPADGKLCSFDCLYCEAGLNAQGPGHAGLPSREYVAQALEEKLRQMHDNGERLDVITFSGNGEPTLHPEFDAIIDDTIRLRDKYFPEVKISVLCNSTRLDRPQVVAALERVDNAILKLDSAVDDTMQRLDRPGSKAFSVETVVPQLAAIGNKGIIQTMMLRGTDTDGRAIDNTTDAEVQALIDAYRRINPRQIMLYSIDRKTPVETLQKVDADQLRAIAQRIQQETNIPVTTA